MTTNSRFYDGEIKTFALWIKWYHIVDLKGYSFDLALYSHIIKMLVGFVLVWVHMEWPGLVFHYREKVIFGNTLQMC